MFYLVLLASLPHVGLDVKFVLDQYQSSKTYKTKNWFEIRNWLQTRSGALLGVKKQELVFLVFGYKSSGHDPTASHETLNVARSLL